MFGADIRAAQALDIDLRLRRCTFLAQVLALARSKRREEIVETGEIVIVPMELEVCTQHPSGFFEHRLLAGFDKGRMR